MRRSALAIRASTYANEARYRAWSGRRCSSSPAIRRIVSLSRSRGSAPPRPRNRSSDMLASSGARTLADPSGGELPLAREEEQREADADRDGERERDVEPHEADRVAPR